MRANNAQGNLNEDRQRDHQRQQERLRAMAATSDKAQIVSADLMIENLLKDSFKKMPQMTSPVNQSDSLYTELPLWLQCESTGVPAQYKYLWTLVQSTVDLADTQKVSQLLLTSGLHVDLLGFIWSLANKAIPGKLTKQEFYIVLALVGLAQTGYTFNNLGILKMITVPSIPVLQIGFQNYPAPQTYVQNMGTTNFNTLNGVLSSSALQPPSINGTEKEKCLLDETVSPNEFEKSLNNQKDVGTSLLPTFSSTSEPHLLDQTKGLKNSNFPYIGSSPTAELEDDFFALQSGSAEKSESQRNSGQPTFDSGDDFTEFQSANVEHLDPFETVVINQKREIPKIPLPKSFTGKFTNLKSNILKISPETEKKLKVLSPNESLSSLPESKISSSNKVSTSISVLGSNQGIGSRLANHSFNAKLDRPKCYKHHKIKINPISPVHPTAEEEIILGVKPRNLESVIPKCRPRNSSTCKTFLLKETKIRSNETEDSGLKEQLNSDINSPTLHSGENTRKIEIPMLGTFNETVLPTQAKIQTSSIDLITVQEDKYSALREIELELQQDKNSEVKEVNDDFGDFLSADISLPTATLSESTSVPAESESTSVPAQSESTSVPAESESTSVPAQSESTSVPAESESTSVPSQSDSISVPNQSNSISVPSFLSSLDMPPVKDDKKEDWGDWSFSTDNKLPSTNISSFDALESKNITEISEIPVFKTENDLFDSFTSLTVNEKQSNDISQPEIGAIDQQDFFWLGTKSDNVGDVSIFEGKIENSNESTANCNAEQAINTQSDNEFWGFLSSDVKSSVQDNFNRHGSLPSLDLKVSPTEESEQEAVWRKCMDSCHGLIQEGYEIFNNITVKSVLDEVFASPKTEDYLNYLNTAFQISKRVSKNFNNIPTTQEDLEKFWGRLQDLCFEYNIKLKHDEDNCSEGKVRCSICLSRIGFDLISQGGGSYHPSCANLWINRVEGTLPFSV